MRRDALLAGTAGTVLVGLLVVVALAPGIAADPTKERERPGHISVRDTAFATDRVGGETVTLNVTTLLEHRGGTSQNITIAYRMVDEDTGLVAATASRDLGNVTGNREVETHAELTVERSGDYDLLTTIYSDGQRVAAERSGVSGTGNLVPAYAESAVTFHQFAGARTIPSVQYGIDRVDGDRVRVNVTAYLTNGGDEVAEDLRVQLIARQADSNVIADSATVPVETVRPGRSVTPSTTLMVADNYTYYLDAVLWKDGVIVGSTRTIADLDPRRATAPNTTAVDLDSDDFAAETDASEGMDTPRPEETATPVDSGGQPGFGLAATAAALCGAVLLAWRWSE
jgi:hypothetical protein